MDRLITADEVAVIRTALDVAAAAPESLTLAERLDHLRVLSACSCGCESIDFVEADEGRQSTPIANAIGHTTRGGTVGIIVWGTSREITGLEIYDLGADADDLRLPVLSSIRPWKSGT